MRKWIVVFALMALHVFWPIFAAFLALSAAPVAQPLNLSLQDSTINNLVLPGGMRTVPWGSPGTVEVVGNGEVDLVLMAGLGFGKESFSRFVEINKTRYRMMVVSAAGYGGSPCPELPGDSYGNMTWTQGYAKAVLELIEKHRFRQPILVAHMITASQAAWRIALDHPDKISGLVLISAESTRRYPDPKDPKGRASLSYEDKVKLVDSRLSQRWFRYVTPKTWNDNMWTARHYSEDSVFGEFMRLQSSQAPLAVHVQYLCEFNASDASRDFELLRIPTLILAPDFSASFRKDPLYPVFKSYYQESWTDLIKNPAVNMVTMEGHLFLQHDKVKQVTDYIDHFLADMR